MFIVIEGLDGAGKSTQVALLKEYFATKGLSCEYLHFPRFDAPYYGELIARFLRGELGEVGQVAPELIATVYAADRCDASPVIRGWLADGKVVIVDRYVLSNVAYQCAKVENRDELKQWILGLEYEYNQIVRADVTLFLDVPFRFTENSLSRARAGNDRGYLAGKEDIHEASLALQRAVREVYLAHNEDNYHIINCADGNGEMRTAAEISRLIIDKIV